VSHKQPGEATSKGNDPFAGGCLHQGKRHETTASKPRDLKILVTILTGILAAFLFLSAFNVFPSQKKDYLTDEEIEQLREAQEPAERIKLLDEFLKERLERAKALKSPDPLKEKGNKPNSERDKNTPAHGKKPISQAPLNKTSDKPSNKSFADLMGEYLQCLEEISSNVENFSRFKTEPKAYLKSLKNLDQSLEEHRRWVAEISSKLDRSEKGIASEVSEALQELSADVGACIQKANEEIKELKESKKGKSRRQ